MGKTSSLTSRKEISWGITLVFWWVVGNPTQIPQSIALILAIHFSGHFAYLSFLLFLQFNFHPSLFQKPENDFSNGRHLALGNGEDKNSCSCPLASGCDSSNIEAECNSCSGCVVPALRMAKRWLSPLMHRVFGCCSSLGSKTLSKALVFVEATSVSVFKFPYEDSIIYNVGTWVWKQWGCGRYVLRQQDSSIISWNFKYRGIMLYGQHSLEMVGVTEIINLEIICFWILFSLVLLILL